MKTYETTHSVAVGAYIFDSARRVLLLRRVNKPHVWAPPGGRLNPDESPFKGIRREIAEETGLIVALLRPALPWFGQIIPGARPVLSIDFLAIAETTEVTLSHEHSDFAWVARSELARYVTYRDGMGYDPREIEYAFELYELLKKGKLLWPNNLKYE